MIIKYKLHFPSWSNDASQVKLELFNVFALLNILILKPTQKEKNILGHLLVIL